MKVPGQTKITRTPIILLDHTALYQIQHMIEKHNLECQWYQQVQRIESEDKSIIMYYIYDLFIPEQTVGSVTVESTPEQMMKMWQDIRKERQIESLKDLNPLIQAATCWSHSHHTMGTTPSGTDDEQWETQKEQAVTGNNKDSVQVMMIMNKRGECFNRVYDPIIGIEFENLPIRVRNNIDLNYVEDAIKNKFDRLPTPKKSVEEAKTVLKKNNHPSECLCHACRKPNSHAIHCTCPACDNKKKL